MFSRAKSKKSSCDQMSNPVTRPYLHGPSRPGTEDQGGAGSGAQPKKFKLIGPTPPDAEFGWIGEVSSSKTQSAADGDFLRLGSKRGIC
jgi:hypothetical protein